MKTRARGSIRVRAVWRRRWWLPAGDHRLLVAGDHRRATGSGRRAAVDRRRAAIGSKWGRSSCRPRRWWLLGATIDRRRAAGDRRQVTKALDLLCAAEDKHYVKVTGTPHGWDVVFYVFQFIKGVLFFTVVVLVGTGWSFLKPFLQDREKKVLIVVIPPQVVANIAATVIGETGPFIKDWMTWKQLFLIIDIVCCCAIIFPIVWSIRSLRETSKTDGKAARNLAKLTLFRKFYILVVGYLYFTRIVVFALETIAAYNYKWVGAAMGEGASLTFYGLMFYMFRPVERNEYFVIDDEEEEAAQAALRDDEFEL